MQLGGDGEQALWRFTIWGAVVQDQACFMGAYLTHPNTEKDVYSGSNKFLEYGGASMQVSGHAASS